MKKITFLCFILPLYLYAQTGLNSKSNSSYNLYNTTLSLFSSKFVDDTFHIFISLPENYDESDKQYPVLYVLDGDVAYGMTVSIARYLELGKSIPDLIIVGIGYGALDEENGNMRNRDYSPSQRKNKPITGGASYFLEFLTAELIPVIDSTYRTVPGDRTISSYSLGGLFALYALFNSPATFNRYIIGSPYLPWGNFAIFDNEESAAVRFTEINAKVFISVGSEESDEKYFDPIDQLVTRLEERNYEGLKIETQVFDGGTHLTGPPESITHGLISVFGK